MFGTQKMLVGPSCKQNRSHNFGESSCSAMIQNEDAKNIHKLNSLEVVFIHQSWLSEAYFHWIH